MDTIDIVVIVIVSLLIVWLVIGFVFAKMIVKPKVRSLRETEKEEDCRDETLIDFYHQHLTKTYAISSPFGYQLQVYEMIQEPHNKRFVVVAHGHTYSHHGSIKFAKMMMQLGYNAILFDQRYHGLSGGKNSSLGYYEKEDLKAVIDHLEATYGKDIYIGTCGESMGSATCLLEQKDDQRIRFVISDAGFTCLETLIKEQMRQKHLPTWLFFGLTNWFVKRLAGFDLSKVCPIEAIQDASIPMLFVHGKQDRFIPYQHAINLYASYSGKKRLFLADGKATHARSYYHHQKQYTDIVQSFIEECVESTICN